MPATTSQWRSEIERIAWMLWIHDYSPLNMVTVLSGYNAYFDASYDGQNTQDKQTVVAGYVSTVEQWAQWEIQWRMALASFNVPYFHMRDFITYEPPFSGQRWKSESYRVRFLSTLIDITREWAVATVGSAIKQSVFNFHNGFYELDSRYNPYVLCGRDCAVKVHRFIREEYRSELPIAYFFEQGDLGKGMLVEEMMASGLSAPSFKRPRPDPKNPSEPPAIQLQACDLIAWEIRRGNIDFEVKGRLRKSLHALSRIKHRKWAQITESDVQTRINSAGIALRPEWKYLEQFPRWAPQKRD